MKKITSPILHPLPGCHLQALLLHSPPSYLPFQYISRHPLQNNSSARRFMVSHKWNSFRKYACNLVRRRTFYSKFYPIKKYYGSVRPWYLIWII